jgi:hypothetical protein
MKKPIVAAIITAATLFAAPPAHADTTQEINYLRALTASNFYIYDTTETLLTGYWICNQLDYVTGDVVAAHLFRAGGIDIPDMHAANIWVVIAATNLCPWTYRGYDEREAL